MKKSILFLFLTFLSFSSLFAQSESDYALLEKCDKSTSFVDTDFSATYTMVQDIPGVGKNLVEAIMYRRDKTSSYTIIITSPSKDKGKGYLQNDNSVWFFDPADKKFTFSSKRDKFQNTNANTSDFAPMDFCKNYKIVSTMPKTLGKGENALNCTLFELEAKVEDVTYPKLKLWVTTEDGLIRKKEDYSLSGQILRTTMIPKYQKIGTRSIPLNMVIVDHLKGKRIDEKMVFEKTSINIKNVSFAKQKDSVFTKTYLELMSD